MEALLQSEIEVLKTISHTNLLEINEILEDTENVYIVNEICEGGELFDRLLKVHSFSEANAAGIIEQVLLGLNYLHKRGMAHRDLKPENVLLLSADMNNISVKLADFGFTTNFEPDIGLALGCGSLLYMAPEIITAKVYNEKVDIWSVGVITFMLLTGKNPFPGANRD